MPSQVGTLTGPSGGLLAPLRSGRCLEHDPWLSLKDATLQPSPDRPYHGKGPCSPLRVSALGQILDQLLVDAEGPSSILSE